MAWPTTLTKVNLDADTDFIGASRAEIEATVDAANDIIASRSAVNGIASTDGDGKVPVAELPNSGYTELGFTPSTTPTYAEGKIYYDSTHDSWMGMHEIDGTSDISNYLAFGEETWIKVYNNTGGTLTKGTVVYITGSQGGGPNVRVTVAKANATDITLEETHALGFVVSDIANASSGRVMTTGVLHNLNTTTIGGTPADGAELYLGTTAGTMTTVKPVGAGNVQINLGTIIYNHASTGQILVHIHLPANHMHGLTSDIVGKDDAQTLTNKTLTSPVFLGAAGYGTGAGGTVTQITSRTTGVTLDKGSGQITLVSAAGSTSWQTFTVTNSTVATTDTVIVNQASGTDLYQIHVTAVAAGSFNITFATTGGTTTETPVFNFAVIKGASS